MTRLVCPSSVCFTLPDSTSQSRTVRSTLPLASVLRSGSKATERTISVWPSSVRMTVPVLASQSLMVLSRPPPAVNAGYVLRPILRQSPRMGHRQTHQILRLHLPQTAAQAERLAEFDGAVRAHRLRAQDRRHRVPAVGLELARRRVVAG